MALEIVFGETRNPQIARRLAEELSESTQSGTIYLGYPILATADDRVQVDALMVSRDHGLIAFLFSDLAPGGEEAWSETVDEQDRLYAALAAQLRRHDGLREGRSLALEPQTATIFPAPPAAPASVKADAGYFGDLSGVKAWVDGLPGISAKVEKATQGALQRVSTIKPPKKRADVTHPSSRGAVLKKIEAGIANLDRWQKIAAIESPDSPQRIRGLAGSGKTVVLALKAAYWHTQHPEWDIAVTFHTRSLYQQIDDLTTRFTFEHSNDRPDPNKLRIMNAWGSRDHVGVYSAMALAANQTPRDFNYARATYGMDEAFVGVCRELLDITENGQFTPIFDAILIDEAQDLPPEFFQLVYRFAKEPKRIAWGYDELQKLSEAMMPSTKVLFGSSTNGQQLVSLETSAGQPRRDIVLPICYRNTPWALATAHALGLGVYRDGGLLQHPDDPALWAEIGYEVANGELSSGERVTLKRRKDSYPKYFEELVLPEDAVRVEGFDSELQHDTWLASEIAENLRRDELDHDDILIVLPDPMRAKSRARGITRALAQLDIPSHLVGVSSSVDSVFQSGSVAIAQIYRAKGNEAPMVYAVDAQHAAGRFNAVTRRNTLFTAITRSRAWVRISGWGDAMKTIAAEIDAVRAHGYGLEFQVPTPDELAKLRRVHRDRSPGEEKNALRAEQGFKAFLDALDRGDVDLATLPDDLKQRLADLNPRRDA